MNNIRLFIIWENGRSREKLLLGQLSALFNIVKVYDILWSPDFVENNFSRLFLCKVDKEFVQKRGAGRFLVVVVEGKPYANDQFELTTKNGLKKLQKYVSKDTFYATSTQSETNRMITLLLGISTEKLLSISKKSVQVELIQRDLDGARGWTSLEELFTVMNQSFEYLILRNWEGLPDNYSIDGHGDIDILVRDRERAILLMNARRVSNYKDVAATMVQVGDTEIQFDIRYVGDNYYDSKWELCMLENRQMYNGEVYVQNDVNYFYSLLYHALVQKYEIKDDYKEKLKKLADRISVQIESWELPYLIQTLDKYMELGKFKYARPNNIYSVFNDANVSVSKHASALGVKRSIHYRWNKYWIPMKKFSQRVVKYLRKKLHI